MRRPRPRLYRKPACKADQSKKMAGGINFGLHETSLLQVNDLPLRVAGRTRTNAYAIAMPANLLSDGAARPTFVSKIERTKRRGRRALRQLVTGVPGTK